MVSSPTFLQKAIKAVKSLRVRCSDQAQEWLDNILLDLYKGQKFQVSVEQEATRVLGNLGWDLMQRDNFVQAEDAYRRALSIAPDNNKMWNLGICLMKQGRIVETKETLRRVKPVVVDGPIGMDSHVKAYEKAQQLLITILAPR
ncbi:Protein POLLENLESS 3-LIKE 2 [Raphanus sativus]|nr:Protein POLLENLESS 3-LIKE 2 [Raphanus sativus]